MATNGADLVQISSAPTQDYNLLGGTDTLEMTATTDFDASTVALTSVEILKADVGGSIFKLNQADISSTPGSIVDVGLGGTIAAEDSQLDLTHSTLSGITLIETLNGGGTKFTVDLADIQNFTVNGSNGADTLIVKGTNFDLTSTGISSIDHLQVSSNAATTFKLDAGDITTLGNVNASITAGTGKDTLTVTDAAFDLSSIALSSVEILKAGVGGNTNFTVNQADLAKGGSIIGGAGTDTLFAADGSLDLTSTTLSSVEHLSAESNASFNLTLNAADLKGVNLIHGDPSVGANIIVVGPSIDFSKVTLSEINIIESFSTSPVTFTMGSGVQNSFIGVDIRGGSGTDTIIGASGTVLDLSNASVSSIEVLKTSQNGGFEFKIAGGAPAAQGGSLTSIIGGSGTDTLLVGGVANLSSTTLASIEHIISDGVILLDQADLAKGGTVEETGTQGLVVDTSTVDLSQTTLIGINYLQGAPGTAITFKLGVNAVVHGTISGNSSFADQIIATGSLLDLTSTTLSSIEKISTNYVGGTEFIVDLADIDPTKLTGGIHGFSGSDSLVLGTANATQFDLTAMTTTALDSIEKVGVDTGVSANLLITHAELLKLKGFIGGNKFVDQLTVTDSTDFDLTSATLSGIESLHAGTTNATTFKLDAADLVDLNTQSILDGQILGTAKSDTLLVTSATVDLQFVDLSSVETVKSTIANSALTYDIGANTITNSPATAFDGNAGKNDTIQLINGITVDFSSGTLSSIEILKGDSFFGVDVIIKDSFLAANSGSLASIVGGVNTDVLEVVGTSVNFLGTTLTGINTLDVDGTTITLDETDILNGSKQTLEEIVDKSGAPGTILQVKSAVIDLSQTELSGIDIIRATGQAAATPITFDISNETLNGLGNGPVEFVGGGGTDTLQAIDSSGGSFALVDLSRVDVSSIEVLKVEGSSFITAFEIKDSVLAANGGPINTVVDPDGAHSSVLSGVALVVDGTSFDLTGTALSGIQYLTAGDTSDTTFTLDQADFFAKTGTKITQQLIEINGNNGNDTLAVRSNTIDLSSVELSSIETIEAAPGISGPLTFIINSNTLDSNDTTATIIGNGAASDTVSVLGSLDLTSTDFSSIETLQIVAATANDYTVDINPSELAGTDNVLQSIVGAGAANAFITIDIKHADASDIDLTSTTFSNIDQLTLERAPHVLSDSLIIGPQTFQGPITVSNTGSAEELRLGIGKGTSFDISQVHFDGQFAGLTMDDDGVNGVNVIVSQDNLTTLGTFNGTAQDDTLTAAGTQFDLLNSSAVLNSVEALATNNTSGTTFTVSQDHLDEMSASAVSTFGSVTGNSGNDTLIVDGAGINLFSTNLSSIETLKAGESGLAIGITAIDLVGLHTIDGDAGTNIGSGASLTLEYNSAIGSGPGAGTSVTFDLSHINLFGIDVLRGLQGLVNTVFTLNQSDIFATTKAGTVQRLTEIDGADGIHDTILAHGTVLDLHGVTLSGIDDISADHSGGVSYTLDGNAMGIELDLMTGTGKNTVTLNVGYDGVIDNTDESHVLSTTLTIDNFTHGLDTIDLSHVATNGTATFDSTAGAQGIADTVVNNSGDLHDILNALQNTYDGSTNSQVLKFEYNGDTYLMVDNATTGSGFDETHDSVVKLSGTGLGVAASDLVVH